jgi:hypothetical protein
MAQNRLDRATHYLRNYQHVPGYRVTLDGLRELDSRGIDPVPAARRARPILAEQAQLLASLEG